MTPARPTRAPRGRRLGCGSPASTNTIAHPLRAPAPAPRPGPHRRVRRGGAPSSRQLRRESRQSSDDASPPARRSPRRAGALAPRTSTRGQRSNERPSNWRGAARSSEHGACRIRVRVDGARGRGLGLSQPRPQAPPRPHQRSTGHEQGDPLLLLPWTTLRSPNTPRPPQTPTPRRDVGADPLLARTQAPAPAGPWLRRRGPARIASRSACARAASSQTRPRGASRARRQLRRRHAAERELPVVDGGGSEWGKIDGLGGGGERSARLLRARAAQ